jgi:hypothetical protein
MSRNGRDRLAAIEQSIAERDAFIARVLAASTTEQIARLLAEAVDIHLAANGLETVGRDGKVFVCMETVCASHCLKAARDAYNKIVAC